MSHSVSLSYWREVKSPVISIPEANFLDLSRSARRNLVNPHWDGEISRDFRHGGVNNRLQESHIPTTGLINIDSGLYSRSMLNAVNIEQSKTTKHILN